MGVEKGAVYGKKITAKESYTTFKRNNPKKASFVSKKDYMIILRAISDEIMINLLEEGNEIHLPSRLGSLQVIKYTPSKKRTDMNGTKLYGKRMPHVNMHSDGYCVRLHWDKGESHANFKNKSLWAFALTKDNKCRNDYSLAKYVKRYGVNHFVERKKYSK